MEGTYLTYSLSQKKKNCGDLDQFSSNGVRKKGSYTLYFKGTDEKLSLWSLWIERKRRIMI